MKKYLIFMLVFALLATFAACSQQVDDDAQENSAPVSTLDESNTEEVATETEASEDEEQEVEDAHEEDSLSLEAVRTSLIEQLSVSDPFLLGTEALLDLYGITSDMVKQSASFVTMSGTFPDEVILVEAVDEDSADAVQDLLQNRLNEVMVQSETYDAENYAAAQACQVWRNGAFVALVLSPNQQAIADHYCSFFE